MPSDDFAGKQRKRTKRNLKIFAGLTLLAAFGIQNLFLKATADQLTLQEKAQRNYMSAYVASLSYANLYFTSGQVTGAFDADMLRKAAQENAAGIGGAVATSGRDKSEIGNTLKGLFQHVDAVHDLDSYNDYLTYVNTIETRGVQKPTSQTDTLSDLYFKTYFFLYLLGSGLALVSVLFE